MSSDSQGPENSSTHGGGGEHATSPQLVARLDVDQFMVGEGLDEVLELEQALDSATSMVEGLHGLILTTLRDHEPTAVSTLLGEPDHAGIQRVEIRQACFENEVTLRIMRQIGMQKHRGDEEAARAYRDLLTTMLNLIRFDMLRGIYDAADPKWQDRAARIGQFSGTTIQMHLGPGFGRERTVTRRTPSGHLPRPAQPRPRDDSENNYHD